MSTTNSRKITAILDEEKHRYVITPLKNGETMDVPCVFRAIFSTTNAKWKDIAAFAGLKRSNFAFRVAYKTNSPRELEDLNPFLVVDVSKQEAYFYDSEHKPEQAAAPYVGPTITNKEDTTRELTTFVPAKVTSRVTVADENDVALTMKVTPTNGYLLGINDVNIALPNTAYVVRGHAKSLNSLLRQMHFIATESGNGQVIVSVDDGAGEVDSIASTTVKFTIVKGAEVSVPTLNIPASPTATLDTYVTVSGLTVADKDNKLMELRLTPFGANLTGFTHSVGVVSSGYSKSVYGRPEVINAQIANLQIKALQENVQLCAELFCGKTQISKYIKFTVGSTDEPVSTTAAPTASTTSTTSVPKVSIKKNTTTTTTATTKNSTAATTESVESSATDTASGSSTDATATEAATSDQSSSADASKA